MVDEVRTGTYRQLFHPEQLISGKEDGMWHGCGMCGDCSVFPDWYHLTWKCPCFAAGRPPEPADAIQLRLAWPPSDADPDYNDAVLSHMAAVGAKVWTFAPSSRGRRTHD